MPVITLDRDQWNALSDWAVGILEHGDWIRGFAETSDYTVARETLHRVGLALELVEFMDNARETVDVGGEIHVRREMTSLFEYIAEQALVTVRDNVGNDPRLVDLDLDAHDAAKRALMALA